VISEARPGGRRSGITLSDTSSGGMVGDPGDPEPGGESSKAKEWKASNQIISRGERVWSVPRVPHR